MLGWTSEDRQLITEMHGAQIEMCTDLKWMKQKLREADSEIGYRRCVAAKAAVVTCQEDIEDVRKSFKWIRNTAVGSLLSIIIAGVATAGNYLIGNG